MRCPHPRRQLSLLPGPGLRLEGPRGQACGSSFSGAPACSGAYLSSHWDCRGLGGLPRALTPGPSHSGPGSGPCGCKRTGWVAVRRRPPLRASLGGCRLLPAQSQSSLQARRGAAGTEPGARDPAESRWPHHQLPWDRVLWGLETFLSFQQLLSSLTTLLPASPTAAGRDPEPKAGVASPEEGLRAEGLFDVWGSCQGLRWPPVSLKVPPLPLSVCMWMCVCVCVRTATQPNCVFTRTRTHRLWPRGSPCHEGNE